MLNGVLKKHIFVVFSISLLSITFFSKYAIAKSSNANNSVMRLGKITSTKCQKEASKICPKSKYKTSKAKLKCIEDNIGKFSKNCVKSFNVDEEEDYIDKFLKNCQVEVSLYCRTKYDKQTQETIIRSPKMCRVSVLQHFKQASAVCQNFLYQHMTQSERNNFNNMQMQRSMGITNGHSRPLFNSHTNQEIIIKRNRNLRKNKKDFGNNVVYSNDKDIKIDDNIDDNIENDIDDENEDDDITITEDDEKKQVRLTNGMTVSVADIKMFYKKYAKKMEKLGEEERNVFLNGYFEKHGSKFVSDKE